MDPITTFSDAELARMIDHAWSEAALAWQVYRVERAASARASHDEQAAARMLGQAALDADAYWRRLKIEQDRRAN